jgi:hypothetical protein
MHQTLWRIASSLNSRFFRLDRRISFRDLAQIAPSQRTAETRIINFYSSVGNIGNFTPVLGIRQMLGSQPDTWNIHDRSMDFEFINRHYSCAIIGGAGLLDRGFDPFWDKFARECTIPAVIWGVGMCAPDAVAEKGVDREVFARAAAKCDLINVRDDLTANHYRLGSASITPCPTIVYVEKFLGARRRPGPVLYSSHTQLVSGAESDAIHQCLTTALGRIEFTDNIQRPLRGLEDIIRSAYCRTNLVVTTRLHGAIIAYGLGIPYIALARDEKVRAFHRLYGNGLITETIGELQAALTAPVSCTRRIEYDEVKQFAQQIKAWLTTVPARVS